MDVDDELTVSQWGCNDVANWLEISGFGQYAKLFAVDHKVDGKILLCLTENDLREKPLKLSILGDIKRIFSAIDRLRAKAALPADFGLTFDSPSSYPCCLSSYGSNQLSRISSHTFEHTHTVADRIECLDTSMKCAIKTALAGVYCCISLLLTSFVMVIVHDRVPDMKTYPPLPDLVLDSIPFIPWAFEVCEFLACVLGIIWCLVLIFHKRRTILLRRMFSLTGTVFFLRCVTMLITSLSVPGVHLECYSQHHTDLSAKLKQALRIWYGMGMSLRGVRTCGDYMFSGHTTVVTLLNHFVTEYTPDDWYYLHTASWVMNLFSIFFILAGHEHYSIDVFVAFYISSRLFLYYHSMAYHTKSLTASDGRTRMWFPLFCYFESGLKIGRVENEYELPLPSASRIKNGCQYCQQCLKFLVKNLNSRLHIKSSMASDVRKTPRKPKCKDDNGACVIKATSEKNRKNSKSKTKDS